LDHDVLCLLLENIAWLHSRINVIRGVKRTSRPRARDSLGSLIGALVGDEPGEKPANPWLAKPGALPMKLHPQTCHSGGALLVEKPGYLRAYSSGGARSKAQLS